MASEKVSFTKVIAASPPLNWLDMLGRRPARGPGPGGPGASLRRGARARAAAPPAGTAPAQR